MNTYSACPDCRVLNRIPLAQAEEKAPVCGRCKKELPLKKGINTVSGSELMLLVQKSPLPVVVDFWAPWCGPCRSFAPVFEQAALQHGGRVVFAKLDTEANPMAGDAFQIRSIPTLMVFKKGLEAARQSGALPLPAFTAWLTQAVS